VAAPIILNTPKFLLKRFSLRRIQPLLNEGKTIGLPTLQRRVKKNASQSSQPADEAVLLL
jgi:hypothetical protein